MIRAWAMRLLGWTHGGLTCPEVGRVLQRYLDGDTDGELAGRIEAHLDECRRCGLDAETYRRIKTTLAAQRSEIPAESIARLRAFGESLVHGDGPAAT